MIGKEWTTTRRRALTLLGTTFGSWVLASCGAQPTPTSTPTEAPPPTPVPPVPTGRPLPATEVPVPTATVSATAAVPLTEVPAVPTRSSSPTETDDALKPEKPKSPEQKETFLFNILLEPFIKEAEARRAARAKKDTEYSRRLDAELNTGRVNFLIFGYGETYEPPVTTKPGVIIGSPTVISINYVTAEIKIISLTHDIRAPEVEKTLGTLGKRLKGSAKRIDQAYLDSEVGGMELMRLTLENATSLAIDFQFAFSDIAIQKLIDSVFQGIEVDVPVVMELNPYYHQGKLNDEQNRRFPEGKVKLSGREAVGFIKAVPTVGPGDKVTDGRPPYSPLVEHNERKFDVINGLMATMKSRLSPGLLKALNDFFDRETQIKEMELDFNGKELLAKSLLNAMGEWVKSNLPGGKALNLGFPEIAESGYVVDPSCSRKPDKMPIHWVDPKHLTRRGEEEIARDWETGVIPGEGFEVPFGANPYGDLIDDYWFKVRAFVKDFLLGR